jgi:ABC-type bacteriocin/lantibiotic exporter with double-glycine peptidase domain
LRENLPYRRRQFLAPECLQISSMDCGVAAVATLLAGYGVRASYERLRELCQTGVDGTSVDSLEVLCNSLGVEVIQHVVPVDLAHIAMEDRFPLIAVVSQVAHIPHFVTVWRRFGHYLQVMDPAGGRRWVHLDMFGADLYPYAFRLPIGEWRTWMGSNSFRDALVQRARSLLTGNIVATVVDGVLLRLEPNEVAALDSTLRLVEKTLRASPGKPAAWNVELFLKIWAAANTRTLLTEEFSVISHAGDHVLTRGAVLLARPDTMSAAAPRRHQSLRDSGEAARLRARQKGDAIKSSGSAFALPPDEDAVRTESLRHIHTATSAAPFREIHRLLGPEARPLAYALLVSVITLTLGSTLELLVYRAAVDAPRLLTTFESRIGGSLIVIALVALLFGLEAVIAVGGASLGRHVELTLRMATLHSIPRAGDHFIRSRPTTDLAYRAHNLVTTGQLPASLLGATRAAGDLLVTLAAIAFLNPKYIAPVLLGGLLFFVTFALTRRRIRELDTRNHVHASRLLALFFDALHGIRPIRLHGYQDSFRSDQSRALEHWRETGESLMRTNAGLDAINGLVGTGLLVSLFCLFAFTAGDPRVFVLLALWAFRIPPTIRSLILFAQSYPMQRLALTRMLEVTRYATRERGDDAAHSLPNQVPSAGAAIALQDVSVAADNTALLNHVSLKISEGEHLAIVGPSGSGKSTLVNVLLGFSKLSSGSVLVDHLPLDDAARTSLLGVTAWIDPAIHLWNSTIRDNVEYAVRGSARRSFLETAEASDLLGVLDQMERGLDTNVGPEGRLISGGEGQRVRLARGLFRSKARLVLLDEAFRGLDRTTRARLVNNARRLWHSATLLFISHDIEHALDFPRVLVVERGQIVEDGSPRDLAAGNSRFRQLLDAETRAIKDLWGDGVWRRLRVAEGRIDDESAAM